MKTPSLHYCRNCSGVATPNHLNGKFKTCRFCRSTNIRPAKAGEAEFTPPLYQNGNEVGARKTLRHSGAS